MTISLSGFAVIFGVAGLDGLFFSAAGNLTNHLKILRRRLEKLNTESSVDDLKKLVDYHNKIFDFSKLLIEDYTAILVGQFVYSTSVICVMGFRVVTVKFDIKFYFFLIQFFVCF